MHFVLFFTVFPASRQCCPGGGRGGGRNNCFFEWCFLPLSICTGFYSVFRSFALFFFAPSAFSIGFYSVFRLHDVTDATLHIGVGWGGMGQSRSCEVDHVVEASSCCWCYRGDVNVPCNLLTLLMLRHAGVGGMLTFHVTCSRCWCYAMLGWGGMLTFHVSMGVSAAQHVIESECNVETSDSANMTKKSAAREQAVRPWLFVT